MHLSYAMYNYGVLLEMPFYLAVESNIIHKMLLIISEQVHSFLTVLSSNSSLI